METTNQNGHIVHASQVITEEGSLTLGTLPLDLGFSQIKQAGKDSVILADGKVVKLTGTDDDLRLLAADRSMRVKQTLIHLYLSGLNLATARDYFVEEYGSPKEFWQKMTELTNFSKAKLENEIKISQGFTTEQIQSLAEGGATQLSALKLLKAPSEKKEAVIAQAEQGRLITSAVVDEIMGINNEDDEEVDGDSQSETTLFQSTQNESTDSKKNNSENINQNTTQNCVDVTATVSHEEVVTEENYASTVKLLEQRLQRLLNAIDVGRNKSFTVRGQEIREEQAVVLAEFYDVKLPSLKPEESEPNWVTEARKLLPKGVAQKFTPLYVMALVDGYLGYIRNQPNKPQIYEVFPKYLKKDAEKACHDIFDVGFAQAKLEAEASK